MFAAEHELRFFLRRATMFLAVPLVLYIPYLPVGVLFGEAILQRVKGPTDQQQIENSFSGAVARDYDLLILGNSRVYRGINPDELAIPSFNFGCDSDTFSQIYHKLQWVRRQGRAPAYLLVGVDPFQFSFLPDVRNHLYGPYLGSDYLADYPARPWAAELYWLRHFPKRLNPKYLFQFATERPFVRANGQYIRPGQALATDRVSRTARRLPIQVHYFEALLQDCQQHGTTVFLCVLPTRLEELAAYEPNDFSEFQQFLSRYLNSRTHLLDFSISHSFKLQDFTDITHLNEVAANEFSRQLSVAILDRLERDPDSTPYAAGRRKGVNAMSISSRQSLQ